MTDDPKISAGTEGARRLLTESAHVLEDLLTGFDAMRIRAVREDDLADGKVTQSNVAMASVRMTILKEVRRHEARVLDTEGLADAVRLDLDDIRSQIGRRLDRIRDAR
ncbi:MAG: hypothetical protein KJO67_01505 [Silicimonas sp.]|nr:hypothetical protein [Silicimonas sp.]